MSHSAVFAFLLAARGLAPVAAFGQGSMQLAMSGPQPHFVATWAPEEEREAERAAVLADRVSLELTDVTLDVALKALTNRAGLRITYSVAMLPAGRRVTIKASDVAVVTAMTEILFRSGLDVAVDQDGALALVACLHPVSAGETQDSGVIVGRVTEESKGSAIVGAMVFVEGTNWSATTNTEGGYRIEGVEPGTYVVRARYIGYAPESVRVVVPDSGDVTANFDLVRSAQQLDELVTTGTILPTEVRALPTPITVISAEDIEAQQPRTLQDLFRQMVPTGIAPEVAYLPQQTRSSTRGASTLTGFGSMKVYLDGVEMSDRLQATVDPNSVDRVEVIRGPQAAAIYGSDAIGGVMQIFTKRGALGISRPQVEAQAGLGPVQSQYEGSGTVRHDYRLSVRGGTQNASYSFGGGYVRVGDWVPGYFLNNPSVYGALRIASDKLSADLSGRFYQQRFLFPIDPRLIDTGLYGAFTGPSTDRATNREETYGIRLGYSPTARWHHSATLGIDRGTADTRRGAPNRTTPADTLLFVVFGEQRKVSVAYSTSVSAQLGNATSSSVTAGVDHYSNSVRGVFTTGAANNSGTIRTAPDHPPQATLNEVQNTGYFGQVQVDFGDALFLTGALRAEDNSTFGDDIGTPLSPRGGISYVRRLGSSTVKLRASYGRAITPPPPGANIPSVTPNQVLLVNPLLGPESQHGFDAGFDLMFGTSAFLSATYYNQTAKDLIQLSLLSIDPVPTYQYRNIARVRNTGWEFEGSVRFRGGQIHGQYAISSSRVRQIDEAATSDILVGDQVLLVPQHTAGVSLEVIPLSSTSMSAGLIYVGERSNYDYLGLFGCFSGTSPCKGSTFALRNYRMTYPAFAKVRLAATQRLNAYLSAFGAIDNLTNNTTDEIENDLPAQGRVTMIGLRLRY